MHHGARHLVDAFHRDAAVRIDVPVRFDTDYLEVDLSAFAAGAIPKIPLIEIKP